MRAVLIHSLIVAGLGLSACSTLPSSHEGHRLLPYGEHARYYSEPHPGGLFLYVQADQDPQRVGETDTAVSRCNNLFDEIAAKLGEGKSTPVLVPPRDRREIRWDKGRCSVAGSVALPAAEA